MAKIKIMGKPMNKEFKKKIIEVCNRKIEQKGAGVGLSFYAFFKNKNNSPLYVMLHL